MCNMGAKPIPGSSDATSIATPARRRRRLSGKTAPMRPNHDCAPMQLTVWRCGGEDTDIVFAT
jgi:hypothetical protein